MLSINEERIILSPENSEGSIENLFSDDYFKGFVGSEDTKQGKVLRSHIFSQKVEKKEIELSNFS